MFCPRCGANNEDGTRFCYSCGRRFATDNAPAPASGPDWSDFRDSPAAPPPPQPTPPPPVAYTPPSQVVISAPPRRNGATVAGAVLVVVALVAGSAYLLTRDDGGLGAGDNERPGVFGRAAVAAPTPAATSAPAAAPPTPTASAPSRPPDAGPVIGPGYKLTAVVVTPPGSNLTLDRVDKRLFDAIVAGVQWEEAAKLYRRRYPLKFIFNNATTNLLLRPHAPEESRRLLDAAGFPPGQGPKFLLASNPGDQVFAGWLTEKLRGLGYNVVSDQNAFTPEERERGIYGLIVDVVP